MRFTALNALRSSMSDSHSPSVPLSVNQASRNVSSAQLPATRANPQCCRNSVSCLSVGSNAMRWALYRAAGWGLRVDLRWAGMEGSVPFLSEALVHAGASPIIGPGQARSGVDWPGPVKEIQ